MEKLFIVSLIFLTSMPLKVRSQQPEKEFAQGFRYLLLLPESYGKDPEVRWPLLLFLHGGGERGNNLNKLMKTGPLEYVSRGKKLPFIIVSPQITKEQYWGVDSLKDFLDDMIKKYKVDKSRIYLTGLSLGGKATWETAIKYPEMFAAIAPVSGWVKPYHVSNIRDVPVWIFHGAKDPVVPVIASVVMADSLKKYNKVKLTIYPEGRHGNWTETYENEDLYKWFLSHKK